ncbi:MAG TPA: hypothetical protein VGA24_00550, partial [Steroidobacteraceae bacterium]
MAIELNAVDCRLYSTGFSCKQQVGIFDDGKSTTIIAVSSTFQRVRTHCFALFSAVSRIPPKARPAGCRRDGRNREQGESEIMRSVLVVLAAVAATVVIGGPA